MKELLDLLYSFLNKIAIKEHIKVFEKENIVSYELKKDNFSEEELIEYDFVKMACLLEGYLRITAFDDVCPYPLDSSDFEDIEAFKEFVSDQELEMLRIEFDKVKFVCDFTKGDNNCIFFTSVNKLCEWLKTKQISDLEERFSKDHAITFLVPDIDLSITNGYIRVMHCNNYVERKFSDEFMSKNHRKIAFRNEHCNYQNATSWLTPDYLHFDFPEGSNEELKLYFWQHVTNLLLSFLATASYIENEKHMILFSGHKKISFNVPERSSYTQEEVKYLYELYKWVYDGESNTDKIYMLRNIITIYMCNLCSDNYYTLLLNNSKKIYNTTIDNFKVYLKNNVEKYFVERNNLRKFLHNTAIDISDEINSIINNITKNYMSSIGVILLSLITYINRANANIFYGAIILYIIYLAGSLLFYVFHYSLRIEIIDDYYNEQLSRFKKILFEDDIPKDDKINKAKEKFKVIFGIGAVLYVLLIIGLILVIDNFDSVAQVFSENLN